MCIRDRKYTENDVTKFMQKLLDVLGIASTNEGGKDYLDVPVSQNTADGVTKSQSVRVHVDGTYEVVTSENGMDGDGLGYANVDTSGSIGYDKLTDEQKAAISNVAVLPEAGIILEMCIRDREGDDLINGERFFAQEQLCYSDATTISINKRALAVFDYLSHVHPEQSEEEIAE